MNINGKNKKNGKGEPAMVNVESLTKRLVSCSAIVVALGVICGTNAYATDPAIGYSDGSYATDGENMCVYDVLSTYTGPANLQAQWNANEIQLRWYNNNTQVIASESTTCNYDSTLTIPQTNPSRTGYTFAGWHVREAMTFSSLSLSNGAVAYGKGVSGGSSVCYWYNPSIDDQWHGGAAECKTNNKYTELENYEWKTEYTSGTSKGTLYGMAHCSKKPGNHSSYSWPQTSAATISQWQAPSMSVLDTYSGNDAANEAKYCWCKATGWKGENQTSIKASDTPLAWVFNYAYGSASTCASACAYYCANFARNYSAFRAALFLGAGTAE